MAVQNDPDLDSLFREELHERASSLLEGAQAVIDGAVTPEIAGKMVREGHTIKGTGRVMGHEVIARGGETCEVIWRWIQHGELEPSMMLGRALSHLVDSLPDALGGSGHGVSGAIDAIRTLVADPAKLAELPEPVEDLVVDIDVGEVDTEDVDEIDVSILDPQNTAEDTSEPDAHDSSSEVEQDPIVVETALEEPPSEEPAADRTENLGTDPTVEGLDERHEVTANGALIFEPDSNGKLQSPVVAGQIIRSAFPGGTGHAAADAHRPQPDEPAAVAQPANEIDITFLDVETSAIEEELGASFGLGGLAGAVETWAAEESVPANAGRLFRLINDVAALRMDLQSLSSQTGQVLRSADARSIPAAESILEAMETARRASLELQENALGLTALSLSTTTSTLPQLIKYLAKKCQKNVELVVEGENTIVDRQMVDRIGEVIRQLIVNAVVHGIELPADRVKAGKASTGTVTVKITSDDQYVTLEVSDNGAGIDWTAVRETALGTGILEGDPSGEDLRTALFSDGFSTNPQSSEFTRDGDGLPRITQIVEEVYGSLNMTTSGEGASFTVTMPTHSALQSAHIFQAGQRSWGIPEAAVLDSLYVADVNISVSERGSTIQYEDEEIPYATFATAAGLDVEGLPTEVLVIQSPLGAIALAVDRIMDVREVATKDLGPLLPGATAVTGVALLGGDDTVLLVDAGRLALKLREEDARPAGPVHMVLVVDDSQGVRQVVSGVLASHGFATIAAGSVADALSALGQNNVDALVVDFSMPRADGVALIHLVRQRYGSIPIVMLSGVASQDDMARAQKAGADAVFDKSDFARGALVEKLASLIAETAPAEA